MADLAALREGVRRSLPEVEEIRDPELRAQVIEAWALSLSRTEFERIEQIRPSGNPNTPPMKRGTQADHIRGVTRMALALATALEEVVGPVGVDRDLLLAGALCHDVGKPFEFSPRNQDRWRSNPARSGWPAIRHPAYGVHVALTVGLPEAVAHAAGAHSGEGELVTRSLENTLVHYADYAFWRVLERAGMLETD
ncbi:MAG TPA: HD domain-containing protein [Chloroflexota bacterium]|jgi:putative nucleotidyltransferase with HDIG domain|nr:HD domain-containing protein [Chloroflexota bacterium]